MTILGVAFTGLVAGVLHVLSGPDHLAAVLPFAVSQPRRALRIGLFWGLGHGAGVLGLGAVVFFARDFLPIEAISANAELLVGVLLVGLGAWAIRRSRVIVVHTHEHDHGDHDHAHPHVHLQDPTVGQPSHATEGKHGGHHHSSLGFGFLHGVAGLGHLVVASPLVALGTSSAVVYLSTYLVGGVVAMTGFALIVGSALRRPRWIPTGLAVAGGTSIAVGLFWLSGPLLA